MNTFKYFFTTALLFFVMAGCKKENNDLSFVDSVASPGKLSVLFDITQDNTGLVTIIPNGEGASSYDVYYGDGAADPVKVLPGKNTQHTYAEGAYTVKIIARGINGKLTEITQLLTVSFKAPENLEVTALTDPSDNFKVNVSAKASYETVFKVYFGDVANEVPQSLLEGATISHKYTTTGTYTVKVVALSGGAATSEFTKSIIIVDPVLLPLTFESPTLDYTFTDFGGGAVTVIDNPQPNGINTSANVAKMVKKPGQEWGGSLISLGSPIDFSANKIFRMKVFSPRDGAKVLLKVENATNDQVKFEKQVLTTVANAWEDLVFDFSTIDASQSYQKIVLIFELGTAGDGSPDYTFLFDDIRLTKTIEPSLPLDMESPTINYAFGDFGGAATSVIDNPNTSAINASAKVVKMIKTGQDWAGSFITLANPIDFSASKTFEMKVYSPKAGANVLLKIETLDGSTFYEQTATTQSDNLWEELTFDFTGVEAVEYQKVVVIFENGIVGDGSANFTYLFDDITLN